MLNKVTLIGNLGKDAEIKATKSGDQLLTFSLATSEKWKDKSGEKKEIIEWHNIVKYGKNQDNFAQYLKKGAKVYVEGAIKTNKYTDKEGVERKSINIIANTMNGVRLISTLQGKESNGDDKYEYAVDDKQNQYGDKIDDEVPF